MIIFCEECGERYVIEAEEFKDTAMIFICRNCNDIIRIPAQKPQQDQEEKARTEAKEA
jgi:RNase P subunit RPR2